MFVGFGDVVGVEEVGVVGYGVGGLGWGFRYGVVGVELGGKGYGVWEYVEVGLLFVSVCGSVFDDDVVVVEEWDGVDEVVGKLWGVGMGEGGSLVYGGGEVKREGVVV